jgi:hypothetical protein
VIVVARVLELDLLENVSEVTESAVGPMGPESQFRCLHEGKEVRFDSGGGCMALVPPF